MREGEQAFRRARVRFGDGARTPLKRRGFPINSRGLPVRRATRLEVASASSRALLTAYVRYALSFYDVVFRSLFIHAERERERERERAHAPLSLSLSLSLSLE